MKKDKWEGIILGIILTSIVFAFINQQIRLKNIERFVNQIIVNSQQRRTQIGE